MTMLIEKINWKEKVTMRIEQINWQEYMIMCSRKDKLTGKMVVC